MTSYVALLRGIGPLNPNMHPAKLRECFEAIGFTHVRTILASGNVLFDAPTHDAAALESKIEAALPERLGFTVPAIVRSRQDIDALIAADPFRGVTYTPKTNLNITFLKSAPSGPIQLPFTPPDLTYTVLALTGREITSVIDLTGAKTPQLMTWLERTFGKDITTRTYRTVTRIAAKLAEPPQP